MSKKDPPAGTSSLVKALRLVELVEENSAYKRLRARDIAQAAKMPQSTVYRFLQVLTDFGYLQFDRRDHAYEPGRKIAAVSNGHVARYMAAVAQPLMERLAAVTGETVTLAVLEGLRARIITRVSLSASDDTLQVEAGQTRPLHCTGLGKCLVAWSAQPDRKRLLEHLVLEPVTQNTITDRAQFASELEKIQSSGYALENGEIIEGISCIAVPVLDQKRQLIAALSISGATHRLDTERCAALHRELQLVAQSIRYR